ncbi:hypothetical protein L208DRAFT_1314736, partial [Tricholoma matsutake]
FTNDTFLMDSLCDDILEKVNALPSQLHVMAIAIQSNVSMGIDAIQLHTPSNNIVFRVILLFFLSQKSLHMILTSNLIIKLWCNIKQSLDDIAAAYNNADIKSSLKSNHAIIELGQHAKLKGVIHHAFPSLHVLVGTVLKKSFSSPTSAPSSWDSTNYIQQLHTHIESIWQVYHSLSNLDSVGLPLVPFQIQKDGHLVTLLQGNKPVAEGCLLWPHPQFIKVIDDDSGGLQQINISPTHSLIELTKVLTPGCIQAFIPSPFNGFLIMVHKLLSLLQHFEHEMKFHPS